MKTQLRIVAGSLRGRRLNCDVNPHMRPMPQMVREALFSILGNAVPDRQFFDLFAGTGAVGFEAISRGASRVTFVERDGRTAAAINAHLQQFGVTGRATLLRADSYRWGDHWLAPDEPVNLFLGPPFGDYSERLGAVCSLVAELQERCAPGSVLVLQGEATFDFAGLPDAEHWEMRKYGRNWLLIWVKETASETAAAPETP